MHQSSWYITSSSVFNRLLHRKGNASWEFCKWSWKQQVRCLYISLEGKYVLHLCNDDIKNLFACTRFSVAWAFIIVLFGEPKKSSELFLIGFISDISNTSRNFIYRHVFLSYLFINYINMWRNFEENSLWVNIRDLQASRSFIGSCTSEVVFFNLEHILKLVTIFIHYIYSPNNVIPSVIAALGNCALQSPFFLYESGRNVDKFAQSTSVAFP